MSRVYNFSAGPAMLPEAVLAQAQQEILNWRNTGMSIMEMSHRSKEYVSIAQQAEATLREIMNIPDNYHVLFMQGGASLQFGAIPLNLAQEGQKTNYLNTGHWSEKAIKEGSRYTDLSVIADTKKTKYTTLPSQEDLAIDTHAAYVHYTPNETIAGVEFNYIPDTGDIPLIADMSSTILSRRIDVTKFGVIYAGAQKNIGPAGLAIVIVRDDLIGHARKYTPAMMDWSNLSNNGSMYNTPPTYTWYLAGLVFEWVKNNGGVSAMGEINKRKADKLYTAIDCSEGFYTNPVDIPYRSRMNVPFLLKDEALNEMFLNKAEAQGLTTLAGHRSVGGMRASIYNAMPESGVDALISFMNEFAAKHG